MSAPAPVLHCLPLNEAATYWRERVRSSTHLALFLDFDGTISPIVSRPDQAAIDPQIKKILEQLRDLGGVEIAVISGRKLMDVRTRVGIAGLMYAGNHGLEIETHDLCFREPRAESLRLELRRLILRLQSLLADTAGVEIEEKGLSVAIHYRHVHETARAWVTNSVAATVGKARTFTCLFGKMVVDIRPTIEWHKGSAVNWILERLSGTPAYPIVLGDDRTDEDAFRALNCDGLSIHVGEPASTAARFWLHDLPDVRSFLAQVLMLRSSSRGRAPLIPR